MIQATAPVIDGWLAAGYDLDADILPVLKARTLRKRDDPIRKWAYFTPAVAKRHAQRTALAAKAKGAGATGSAPEPKPTAYELMVMTADWINSGRYVPPSAVSTSKRAALLAAGLVTEATLRARQIYCTPMENRMPLTPRGIEDRFEEAAYTLRHLPEKDRPRGYGGSWPSIVQEAKHPYGYTPEAPMRVIPSAAAITRMEECFDWLMLIAPEDARIVWLRADGMRWRQVCIRAGVVRSNAWRRWAAALLTIAKKLNSQTKTKRKLRVPDEPRAIPRESVANTQDNPQNTLTFRRDISPRSGAQKR